MTPSPTAPDQVPDPAPAPSPAPRSPENDEPVTVGFAVFDTPIGPCGVAWGPAGITGMQLPEGTATQTLADLAQRFPGASAHAVPPAIAAVLDRIVAVLDGGSDDLGDVTLDLRGRSGFECRAYAVARAIPPGSTMTYGEVAAAIGNPGLARAVGRAMGGNPFPIIVPCHRVLGADGTIGGFSAPGGPTTKRRMLLAEGVAEREGPTLFDAAELYPAGPAPDGTRVSTSL